MWEGLFRIACLIKSSPLEEPVSEKIRKGIDDIGNGAIDGTAAEQIFKARAAMALFEYNTDQSILKRIAEWMRWLEIEFENICLHDMLLYRPADLMELFIRFYQITGMKSVLRLCAKLRATAFDWITALHTYQQSIPLLMECKKTIIGNLPSRPEDLDYDDKQRLVNHAEMLADGVRYSVFSGLFSGHGQDLYSGSALWSHVSRSHRAICGGTTANPYLCGRGSNEPVGNAALAAWTEAFAAQMILPGSEWALDEMIRIVFNGLEECLNHQELAESQYVNSLNNPKICPDEAMICARLTRAVASACRNAVTLTEEGIRINYLLPAKFLLMIGKQPVILITDRQSARFQCSKPFSAPIDIYIPHTGTGFIRLIREGTAGVSDKVLSDYGTKGKYLRTKTEWHDHDGFLFEQDGTIVAEDTHHQGVCFFKENRLLSLPASEEYAFAVNGPPMIKDGKIYISLSDIPGWGLKGDQPSDIPVLPAEGQRSLQTEMSPYSETEHRITMFPRTRQSCLR